MKPGLFEDFEQKLTTISTPENRRIPKEEDAIDAEQRTKDWFRIRLGRITGSKMPSFMKKGRGGNIWGEMAKKVIFQAVAERTMSEKGIEIYLDEEMKKDFRQTQWGNYYEPIAKDAITDTFGFEIKEVGAAVVSDVFSTSPDGIIKAGEPIEIKCPYDPIKHEYSLSLETDVERGHEYFWQMQAHIYALSEVMGKRVERCHFFSYDPRRRGQDNLVHFVCKREDEAIDEMKQKLHKAELIIKKRLDVGVYDFDV